MVEEDFDFGTVYNESFLSYISKMEGVVDRYLAQKNMSPALASKIVSIFCDVMYNSPSKMRQFMILVEAKAHRSATLDDLSDLVEYFRERLNKKIERKYLGEIFPPKLLNSSKS